MTGIIKAAMLVSFLLAPAMASAMEADPNGSGWQLIHEGSGGSYLYMDPGSMERSPEGFIRVWMKYTIPAANSPSPMLFYNELDCARGQIKRLAVRLYRSTAEGSGEPFKIMTFAGKWDAPAKGNEEHLLDAVCRENSGG